MTRLEERTGTYVGKDGKIKRGLEAMLWPVGSNRFPTDWSVKVTKGKVTTFTDNFIVLKEPHTCSSASSASDFRVSFLPHSFSDVVTSVGAASSSCGFAAPPQAIEDFWLILKCSPTRPPYSLCMLIPMHNVCSFFLYDRMQCGVMK